MDVVENGARVFCLSLSPLLFAKFEGVWGEMEGDGEGDAAE
jgi:hypothetical protein